MLDQAGRVEFTGEVLDLVESLWSAYEQAHGRPASHVERLAGLAYVVAALRQDVEAVWSQILAAPEASELDLAGTLQDALPPPDEEKLQCLRAELERRGWLA